MNKIGLFPAWKVNAKSGKFRGGWIWYNFWWAKADYIRLLEKPRIDPKHRYYYEEWLSYLEVDTEDKYQDSFSIYSMSMKAYNNQEALDNVEHL
ncbi:MAG: hypothetical protein E6Q83_06415 [Thiothrix sp.]|nr:MAG: hypothetical protein E6Q83_06415 [Thiothrix sp.]